MQKTKIGKLPALIKVFDKAQKSVVFYGTYGIGKSEVVYQSSQQKAIDCNKTFIDWMRATDEDKRNAINNPEKYCAFIDIRLSQFEPSDIKGLPIIAKTNTEYLETLGWSWINYITKPGATGTLFLDEINLVLPSIAAAAYQIINDRIISDKKISENINIVAAGNLLEDNPDIFELSLPLKDRFAEYIVEFDKDAWLQWAAGKINPRIYSFCVWNKSMIFQHNDGKDKDVTPRGIKRASDALEFVEDESLKRDVLGGCLGTGWTIQFLAYCKLFKSLDWDQLIKKPTSVSKLNIDEKYAVMGGIVEKLFSLAEKLEGQSTTIKTGSEEDTIFRNYVNLMLHFDSELFVLAKLQLANNKKADTIFNINLAMNKNYKDLNKLFGEKHASKIR